MILRGPLPELLILHHLPGTFEFLGLPFVGPLVRTLGLHLPCSVLHFQLCCVQGQTADREKRSSGTCPHPPQKIGLLTEECSPPSAFLVFWVLATNAVATRKFISQFLEPELEGFSWSPPSLCQCPFLGFFRTEQLMPGKKLIPHFYFQPRPLS